MYLWLSNKRTRRQYMEVDGQLPAEAALLPGSFCRRLVGLQGLSGCSAAVMIWNTTVWTYGGSLVAIPSEQFRLHAVSAISSPVMSACFTEVVTTNRAGEAQLLAVAVLYSVTAWRRNFAPAVGAAGPPEDGHKTDVDSTWDRQTDRMTVIGVGGRVDGRLGAIPSELNCILVRSFLQRQFGSQHSISRFFCFHPD
jgi:hypothetical protein